MILYHGSDVEVSKPKLFKSDQYAFKTPAALANLGFKEVQST